MSNPENTSTTLWQNADIEGRTRSGFETWLQEAIHLVKVQLKEAETEILDEGLIKITNAKTDTLSGFTKPTMYWCETPYKKYLLKGEALHFKKAGRVAKRKFYVGGICIDKETWTKFYEVWGREPTLLHYDSTSPPAILFRYNFGWVNDMMQDYTQADGQEVILFERCRWEWEAKDDVVIG